MTTKNTEIVTYSFWYFLSYCANEANCKGGVQKMSNYWGWWASLSLSLSDFLFLSFYRHFECSKSNQFI